MKLKVEFTIDNAAFVDNADEMPSIIEGIANRLGEMCYEEQEAGLEPRTIRDSNGNRIGSWEISK